MKRRGSRLALGNAVTASNRTWHDDFPADGLAIRATDYDTAWVASLADPANERKPRFPASLRRVIERQHPRGSWGEALSFAPDQLVCTLAGLAAVSRFPTVPGARDAARRAEAYLAAQTFSDDHPSGLTIGFELLLPSLSARARHFGASVPDVESAFAEQRARKLALLPGAADIASEGLSSLHSLEALGPDGDYGRARDLQASNGSIGNSPAATAWYLEGTNDARADAYLCDCLELSGDGGVPFAHPAERFETMWRLYHYWLAGIPLARHLQPSVAAAVAEWYGTDGVTFSVDFPVAYLDDTATAAVVLAAVGRPPSRA